MGREHARAEPAYSAKTSHEPVCVLTRRREDSELHETTPASRRLGLSTRDVVATEAQRIVAPARAVTHVRATGPRPWMQFGHRR